jgi:hypothetical protein
LIIVALDQHLDITTGGNNKTGKRIIALETICPRGGKVVEKSQRLETIPIEQHNQNEVTCTQVESP